MDGTVRFKACQTILVADQHDSSIQNETSARIGWREKEKKEMRGVGKEREMPGWPSKAIGGPLQPPKLRPSPERGREREREGGRG